MTLTVRQSSVVGAVTKGSPLTYAELDGNFAHLSSAANITVTQSGTGTVSTTAAIKNYESLSLFDFCTDTKKAAIRGGTQTDVSAEFILAVAEACSSGRDLEINEGTPVISGGIVFTKGVRLWGHGMRSLLYVDSAVGASTDILKISPGAANDASQTGYLFENFYMLPVSGTPGRHAIAIDITTRAVYSSLFRKLRLNALGGKGFVTLPNASPLTDGFFTSSIQDCTIYNGIYLDKAGDSLRIVRNTLAGANASLYADLVFVSSSNKAHGLTFADNNCTSSGGGCLIKSAYGAVIGPDNIFENTAGTANNALVDLDGTDATNMPQSIKVIHNTFNTPSGVDAVRSNFMRRAQVAHNNINEPGGGGVCLKVTANATDTQYLFNDTNLDSTIASQISDAGTRTVGVRQGLAGYLEIFGGDQRFASQGANIRMSDTAGTAVRVVRWESADNTVKLGAIDAPATNGDLLLYANGAIAGRFAPTGPFRMQGDGSNSAPSFSFVNETNTGFYRTGTAQLTVSVNGTARYEYGSSTNGFTVHQTHPISWGSSGVTGQDTFLFRDAPNTIAQKNGNSAQENRIYAGNGGFLSNVKTVTESLTIAAAATTVGATTIPAGAILLAVSVRVTTVIPTAATFTVTTTAGGTTLNTAAVSTASGSTDPGTAAGALYKPSSSTVTITPNLTPGAATGVVRLQYYYLQVTPATS